MIELPTVPGLTSSDPATDEELRVLEAQLDTTLPRQYRELLTFSNGFNIHGIILVYGTKECVERNHTWEVSTYAPGYIAIGDTGGGEVLLLQTETDNLTLWIVGTGVMTPDAMRQVAPTLEQWLSDGCTYLKTSSDWHKNDDAIVLRRGNHYFTASP